MTNKHYQVRILPTDFGRTVMMRISRGTTEFPPVEVPADEFDQFMKAMRDAFDDYEHQRSRRPPKRLMEIFAEEADLGRGTDHPAS